MKSLKKQETLSHEELFFTLSMIDISQPLYQGMPVWPGDTPFSFSLAWTKEESGSVNVGQMKMSTHVGTHIDAPFHFDNQGQKVIELALQLYVGPARVIEISAKESIGAEDLLSYHLEGTRRLLIKTNSWTDRRAFPEKITYLRPDIGPYLAAKGIWLIGVDVPSVDPLDSQELQAHHQLHEHGIHILEGIVLDHVPPDEYELIALPLALAEADGSPVRAILRK